MYFFEHELFSIFRKIGASQLCGMSHAIPISAFAKFVLFLFVLRNN